ncbi:hypothetical protein JCM10450v2_002691 [Rhodotorula kratochvilovae]
MAAEMPQPLIAAIFAELVQPADEHPPGGETAESIRIRQNQRDLHRFGRVCRAWRRAVEHRLSSYFVVTSDLAADRLLALIRDEQTAARHRPKTLVLMAPALGRTAGTGAAFARLLDASPELDELCVWLGGATLGRKGDELGVPLKAAIGRLRNLRQIDIWSPDGVYVEPDTLASWLGSWPRLEVFDGQCLTCIPDFGPVPRAYDIGEVSFPRHLRNISLDLSHVPCFTPCLAAYLASADGQNLRYLSIVAAAFRQSAFYIALIIGLVAVAPNLRQLALCYNGAPFDPAPLLDFTPVLSLLTAARMVILSTPLFDGSRVVADLLPHMRNRLATVILMDTSGEPAPSNSPIIVPADVLKAILVERKEALAAEKDWSGLATFSLLNGRVDESCPRRSRRI